MIQLFIPTLRKKILSFPVVAKPAHIPDVKQQQHSSLDDVEQMFMQRQAIIAREFAKADYQAGDLVRPVREEDYKNLGVGRVKGVVKNYKDWPKHVPFPVAPALPFITLIEPVNGASGYTCTSQYVRKLTDAEKNGLDFVERYQNLGSANE